MALNNSKHIELPDNVTRSISGDRPRTVCLWARIDKWKNKARIFEYGRKAPQGELFGLRTWNVPGELAVELPWNVRNHWDNRRAGLSTNVSMVPAPTPSPTTPQPTLEPGMSRRLDGRHVRQPAVPIIAGDLRESGPVTPETWKADSATSVSAACKCSQQRYEMRVSDGGGSRCSREPNPWFSWHVAPLLRDIRRGGAPEGERSGPPRERTLYVDGRKEGFWKNATVGRRASARSSTSARTSRAPKR